MGRFPQPRKVIDGAVPVSNVQNVRETQRATQIRLGDPDGLWNRMMRQQRSNGGRKCAPGAVIVGREHAGRRELVALGPHKDVRALLQLL